MAKETNAYFAEAAAIKKVYRAIGSLSPTARKRAMQILNEQYGRGSRQAAAEEESEAVLEQETTPAEAQTEF